MTVHSLGIRQTDRIVFVLTVFLLSCFMIFEKYGWGKYAFFVASGLIYLVDLLSSRKLVLKIDKIHKCFGIFVLFCFMSVLWAINRNNALEWSKSLLNNLICITLLYPYYSKKRDISLLLSVIMWSSYTIAIYTILYYGVDKLLASSYTQYIRLGNDFSNVNVIGMFCAFGLLVQFERIMNDKRIRWYVVFALPSLIVVAATQSRKAVIVLVVGAILIAVLRSSDKRRIGKTIIQYFVIILSLVFVMYLISRISIFSGVSERFNLLLSAITGDGNVDSGTLNRQNYIELGMRTWLQYPFGGVGINCPRLINAREFGENVYLHNNYVELLCGVGIAGFLIYYYMYFYLIIRLMKNRIKNKRFYIIGITWTLLLLIIDFGAVSYYSKIQAFYFMMLFINVKCLTSDKYENVKKLTSDHILEGAEYELK